MIQRTLRDIRFWILLFFLVRLIGITNPPLETGHNWRQTTVTMVARNFVEVDNNITLPRIDIAGEKTGITGMEFPVLNYLIYLLSELFGYDHWYGRLINLITSSFGVFYFFKLIKRFFSEKMALYSSIILLSSIWFSFSRKIMPDTFAMSLVIISVYHGFRYLYDTEGNTGSRLLILLITGGIGVLAKLPAGYLFLLYLIPLFDAQVNAAKKAWSVVLGVIMISPALFWYFYWVPHLVNEYEFWHYFMGVDMMQGFQELQGQWGETLSRFYDDALKFIGFIVFISSIIFLLVKKKRLPILILTIASFGFVLIMLKAGRTFYHHNYYIIPYVPVMAFIAGYGLSHLKRTWMALVLLAAIGLEGTINQSHDFRIKDKYLGLLELEADLDNLTQKDDLILINSGDYPTPMYFAHRKGWVSSNEKIADPIYLDSLQSKGLDAIVILKRSFGSAQDLDREPELTNEDYSIYLTRSE